MLAMMGGVCTRAFTFERKSHHYESSSHTVTSNCMLLLIMPHVAYVVMAGLLAPPCKDHSLHACTVCMGFVDGFTCLSRLFSRFASKSSRCVNKCDNWKAKFVCMLHETQCFSVAIRLWHAKVAVDVFLQQCSTRVMINSTS